MFNWFRRKTPDEEPLLTEDEITHLRQEIAVQNVKDAIDVINAEQPFLPRGMSPWMDWSGLPHTGPRLRLKQRNWQQDTIIHG